MYHAGIRRSCSGTIAPPDDLEALRHLSLKIQRQIALKITLQLRHGHRHVRPSPIDLPDNVRESRSAGRPVLTGRRLSMWINLPDTGLLSGKSVVSLRTHHERRDGQV